MSRGTRPGIVQRQWAERMALRLDERGYVTELSDNLFEPLLPDTMAELSEGDGSELGNAGLLGKVAAPHSSSALAINVFQYWRSRPKRPLTEAVGCGPITSIRFEQRSATGFGPKPANLDVVLTEADGDTVAIESKFCEPYDGGVEGKLSVIKEAYVDLRTQQRRERWALLPNCLEIAKATLDGKDSYRRLDAAQLLRHIVALTHAVGSRKFVLLLLWYAPREWTAADEMRREIDRFAGAVGEEVRFRTLTYQELFAKLRVSGAEHRAYLDYLADRYFADS